jgi:hypothetical protein
MYVRFIANLIWCSLVELNPVDRAAVNHFFFWSLSGLSLVCNFTLAIYFLLSILILMFVSAIQTPSSVYQPGLKSKLADIQGR